MKANIYTGNGSSRSIDVGFKPDLIWIKDRDDTNNHNNNLIDSVNGAPNLWMTDNPTALVTNSTDGLTAITSNGFTLGANTAGTQSYELKQECHSQLKRGYRASLIIFLPDRPHSRLPFFVLIDIKCTGIKFSLYSRIFQCVYWMCRNHFVVY